MKMVRTKAQSTLEYTLILAAIVAAVIVASAHIKTKVEDSIKETGNVTESAANQISQVALQIPTGNTGN